MSDQPTTRPPTSTWRAVRHQFVWVLAFLLLGLFAGTAFATSSAPAYTSTARVLVNPADGNPFVPTPSSVRQDELTSLETEAQVAKSVEVLGAVATQYPDVTVEQLRKRISVLVPANTQILEISYTGPARSEAQQITDAVADAYLTNRTSRSDAVNSERIEKVATRTEQVVSELRSATEAAQVGTDAERLFQSELADSLRNELVSLRAQRTALENSEAPSGSVIAPATVPSAPGDLTLVAIPVGGALIGILLGCLVALLIERLDARVRTSADVAACGVPVLTAVPSRSVRQRLRRSRDDERVDTAVRRLRATLLGLEPRPLVVAVTPAGRGSSDANVAEAVAGSFARAGHRVALVRVDACRSASGIDRDEPGLAQLLTFERLNVVELLQPSVDPLLSILPDGQFTEQSRELLVADRLRAVLRPLVEAGHVVVVQAPGIDSPEAEAVIAAADLALVVVRRGRTRLREVGQAGQAAPGATARGAVVLDKRDVASPVQPSDHHDDTPVMVADRPAAARPSDRSGQ